MKIRDPQIWAVILDANPFPSGCAPHPAQWCAWCLTATPDQRGELYGAVVVLAAERWADAMERALEATGFATPPAAARHVLAPMAVATLREINDELGPFALTDFQTGCALTMLEQTWLYGDLLREALEIQLLEGLLVPSAGRAARRV